MAVAPGFVNMLSWATETLLRDPRALSDVRQGVTLEVFGEGRSMGPLNPRMKAALQERLRERLDDPTYVVSWTTLSGYLEHLEKTGVGVNIASFVGATTLRIHELGYADREPTTAELARMEKLCEQAMQEGALGLGSALIYAPAFYAKSAELTALAKVVSKHDGMYISHMRSEGVQLLEAFEELLGIAREAAVRAEIYHLKAAGKDNWKKLETLITKIEEARSAGLKITANMYPYTAGATGLDAAMPPWVQEGGYEEWRKRLQDPQIRQRVKEAMQGPGDNWENVYHAAGSAENVVLVGFRTVALKKYSGKTLAAVAKLRGKSPEETAMDLVVEDGSRVECVYFLMSERNVRRKLELPWVSFCSDAGAPAPEGKFLESIVHPRAYGSFARVLGRYCREEKILKLGEAIRRLTSLPAENLRLQRRGKLQPGYFADIVVFDPAKIADRSSYEEPHRLAVGVRDVFVNGVQVLKEGMHTKSLPGQVVRGPGWR